MNSIFCPSCGSKNEYMVQKPKFCGSCGQDIDAFFKKKVASAITVETKKTQEEKNEHKISRRRPTPIYERQQNSEKNDDVVNDDERLDKEEIRARGRELANSLESDAFVISYEKPNTIKLKDILDQIAEKAQNNA